MYEIHLAGCSKAVWSYKTWGFAMARLDALAALRTIASATVKQPETGKEAKILLNPEPGVVWKMANPLAWS
jgi:hypothetical protein